MLTLVIPLDLARWRDRQYNSRPTPVPLPRKLFVLVTRSDHIGDRYTISPFKKSSRDVPKALILKSAKIEKRQPD